MDKTVNSVGYYWKTRTAQGSHGHIGVMGTGELEQARSRWLVEEMRELDLRPESRIFEIGCGCGRNLWYLLAAGYTTLGGVEINATRCQIARLSTGLDIALGEADAALVNAFNPEMVFTHGCLMHLEDPSHLIRGIQSRYFLIVERERGKPDPIVFQREYRPLFERFGWVLVDECGDVPRPPSGDIFAGLFERKRGHGNG